MNEIVVGHLPSVTCTAHLGGDLPPCYSTGALYVTHSVIAFRPIDPETPVNSLIFAYDVIKNDQTAKNSQGSVLAFQVVEHQQGDIKHFAILFPPNESAERILQLIVNRVREVRRIKPEGGGNRQPLDRLLRGKKVAYVDPLCPNQIFVPDLSSSPT
eukprot:CAMPEP_0184662724 /NCGR_PEP_ID=MMETSP0308-20130426/44660_1 /TAXON_ID=38269 /ORGANISM="Gloeochaete witrockiana, Strain SAG 46.84" /LENGTH=156 /DNA_ID=CAMNT_0027104943 /DNA_START=250 /DNA_END=720 /DNA_ORIENTATION=-